MVTLNPLKENISEQPSGKRSRLALYREMCARPRFNPLGTDTFNEWKKMCSEKGDQARTAAVILCNMIQPPANTNK